MSKQQEAEEAFAVVRAIRGVMDQTLASDRTQLERIMDVLDSTDIGAIGGRREATPKGDPMPADSAIYVCGDRVFRTPADAENFREGFTPKQRERMPVTGPYERVVGPQEAAPMPGPALTSPIDEHLYRDRADKYEAALMKINAIRNSIIGTQGFNFSEHAYPLVAALDEAGMVGAPYPEARANVGTLIERATQAEAETARLSSILRHLGGILGNEDPQTMHYAASRAVGDAEAWKARAERHATDLRAALDTETKAADGSGPAQGPWDAALVESFAQREQLTTAEARARLDGTTAPNASTALTEKQKEKLSDWFSRCEDRSSWLPSVWYEEVEALVEEIVKEQVAEARSGLDRMLNDMLRVALAGEQAQGTVGEHEVVMRRTDHPNEQVIDRALSGAIDLTPHVDTLYRLAFPGAGRTSDAFKIEAGHVLNDVRRETIGALLRDPSVIVQPGALSSTNGQGVQPDTKESLPLWQDYEIDTDDVCTHEDFDGVCLMTGEVKVATGLRMTRETARTLADRLDAWLRSPQGAKKKA